MSCVSASVRNIWFKLEYNVIQYRKVTGEVAAERV